MATAHIGDSNFDSSALDKAVAEIKTALADYKQSNGQVASESDINTIINDVLANNGLENVITADEVSKLVTFAKAYQETSAIDSAEVVASSTSSSNRRSNKFQKPIRIYKIQGF